MIKLLVVDDSPVVRELLESVFSKDPDIQVMDAVASGHEAIAAIEKNRPDVITMDINMPGMDGIETTRHIMNTAPIPIVILTSSNIEESVTAFRAVEAGALVVLAKPVGPGHADYQKELLRLRQTVKLMSEIKLVTRKGDSRRVIANTSVDNDVATCGAAEHDRPINVIAMGASTGGPQALHTILTALPADLPVPIVIVQHIASGFLPGLVEWLSRSCSLSVRIAQHGELLQPGHVYFACDNWQMAVRQGGIVQLETGAPEFSHRPSVTWLLRSVARTYGPSAIGVLLTGMGRDGADGLKDMKEARAFTIAQDERTSTIYGMPAEAVKLGAASCVLPLEGIAEKILGKLERLQSGMVGSP